MQDNVVILVKEKVLDRDACPWEILTSTKMVRGVVLQGLERVRYRCLSCLFARSTQRDFICEKIPN